MTGETQYGEEQLRSISFGRGTVFRVPVSKAGACQSAARDDRRNDAIVARRAWIGHGYDEGANREGELLTK
jgi:hypothetical protein